MASASASSSSRRRSSSSLAARSAWRPMVSASRRASARIRSAWTRGPGAKSRHEDQGDDAAEGTDEQSEECRHASVVHLGPGGFPPAPALSRTPGLLTASAGWAGAHARRQRLKRAFPGLADRAARRFDRVEASPSRINTVATSGPGSPARPPAQGDRAASGAMDTETRVLSLAAIGPPPGSRAGHPSGRTTARAAGDAGTRRAPAPTAAGPASSAGTPPPRGRSMPRSVRANSPPRERSSSPFQIVGNVVGARPSPPRRPDPPRGSRTRGSKVLASFTISHE